MNNILHGLFLLARGERAGIREFDDSLAGFSASIAPLIAFPLVGAVVEALRGQWQDALIAFLAQICAVLVQPVIGERMAHLWRRGRRWLLLAVALNWSVWIALPLMLLAGIVAGLLGETGLPQQEATTLCLGAVAAYLFWYQWFVSRAALDIGGPRALLLVVVTNVTVAALILGPDMVEWASIAIHA